MIIKYMLKIKIEELQKGMTILKCDKEWLTLPIFGISISFFEAVWELFPDFLSSCVIITQTIYLKL